MGTLPLSPNAAAAASEEEPNGGRAAAASATAAAAADADTGAVSRRNTEAFFGGKDVCRLLLSALQTGVEDITPSAPPRIFLPRDKADRTNECLQDRGAPLVSF